MSSEWDLVRITGAVGLLAAVIGLVEILEPGAIPLPIGEEAVYVVAAGVALYGYVSFRRRRVGTYVRPPVYERGVISSPPGESLHEALAEFGTWQLVPSKQRTRAGLRETAIEVLARYGDLSDAEARRQVETGRWTDDEVAAAYLAEDDRQPWALSELRRRLAGTSGRSVAIERTVDAIVKTAGLDDETADIDEGDRQPIPDLSDRTDALEMAINTTTQTGHWYGMSLVAVVGIAVGILLQSASILLVALLGIGFLAYAKSSPDRSVRLSIERTFDTDPDPGDSVEVTVMVKNEGDRLLPDLRVIDGVPPALVVEDPPARLGTVLRPGGTATFRYRVTAQRGSHQFQPAIAVTRTRSAGVESVTTIETDDTITCHLALQPTPAPVPLRRHTSQFVGSVATTSGGEGIEFYATREYRPGDPQNRIDWHRRARTGTFATLEFMEERAVSVVLVIDALPSAYVAHGPGETHALDRSVAAASAIFPRLLDDGHRVGIATFGPQPCYLEPGTGSDQRVRGRRVLSTAPALASEPVERIRDPISWKRRLRRRLPVDAQLIVCSPCWRRLTTRTIHQFDAHDYPVSVVSPDPTATRTPAQRLMAVRRSINLAMLRDEGIPLVDWSPNESLETALTAASHRRVP